MKLILGPPGQNTRTTSPRDRPGFTTIAASSGNQHIHPGAEPHDPDAARPRSTCSPAFFQSTTRPRNHSRRICLKTIWPCCRIQIDHVSARFPPRPISSWPSGISPDRYSIRGNLPRRAACGSREHSKLPEKIVIRFPPRAPSKLFINYFQHASVGRRNDRCRVRTEITRSRVSKKKYNIKVPKANRTNAAICSARMCQPRKRAATPSTDRR